jgi:hypothetical protein
VALADTVAAPRPLHLRNRELPFWFEHLPADDLIYFQFNSVRDHPAETFAAFCDRLFGYIEDQHVGRLVIDLRGLPPQPGSSAGRDPRPARAPTRVRIRLPDRPVLVPKPGTPCFWAG